MTRFIARRLLVSLPVLFGLSILLFAFIHLLPGDPAAAILGEHATPEAVAQMRAYLGLDDPLPVQYGRWILGLLHGDFGKSIVTNRPVLGEYLHRLPATIELTTTAILLATALGVPLGRFAAHHAQRWPDGTVTLLSLAGLSIPVFLFGLILQVIFAVDLHLVPATGRLDARTLIEPVTNFMLIDPWLMSGWSLAKRAATFLDALHHLILPALTQASVPLAIITRITRASVLEASHQDYVRTARAKGLGERYIQAHHIMPNAWLPIVTIIGLQSAVFLGGAVLTETVFAWNGLGSWVVQAVAAREYFIIQTTILIFALTFLLVNLLVDLLYAWLNPRIHYG